MSETLLEHIAEKLWLSEQQLREAKALLQVLEASARRVIESRTVFFREEEVNEALWPAADKARTFLTALPAQPTCNGPWAGPIGTCVHGFDGPHPLPAQPTEGARWWCEACKREYDGTPNGGWLCGGHVLRPAQPTEVRE